MPFVDRDAATARILRRPRSVFGDDLREATPELRERVRASRILVIGAAGSVGSAFVRELLPFRPRALYLVDPDENRLTELVRWIRSAPEAQLDALSTYSIALGSPEFDRWHAAADPPDIVLNFAALKHVRAERDVYTLMRLLYTNVLAFAKLAEELRDGTRLFSVSSDKAVRPTSLMGASKAWMEAVLDEASPRLVATSARFANVAFSAGSLLDGFLHRLASRQPLAAPSDIRRFFISEQEAGHLCLLAAIAASTGEILVPRVDALQPIGLDEVAQLVLEAAGLRAVSCASEEEARAHPALRAADPTTWPCYFAPSGTSGEKNLEEFVGPGEDIVSDRYKKISVIRKANQNTAASRGALIDLAAMRERAIWDKMSIVSLVRQVVPTLDHIERGASLDERM